MTSTIMTECDKYYPETGIPPSKQNGNVKQNEKNTANMITGYPENFPLNCVKPTPFIDETDIEVSRRQKLFLYLTTIMEEGDITKSTANIAWDAWRRLYDFIEKRLPVPVAGPGPDGQLLYVRDKGIHHFEMEIFPDNHAEFFYLNRETDGTWELDYIIGNSLNDEIKKWLGLCV